VERLKGRRGDTTNEMRPTSALPTDFSNEDLNATNTEFETKFMSKDAYEGVTPEIAKLELQNKFMKITNLQKQYDTGLLAVRGINLKLYVDQIFVMLGHNGAGKTSTISLLTGLYEPTKGSAEVFGINMFEDFHEVR
jgi:ATP-binding cassette subfamily A (ABC1) protein 3